MTAFYEGSKLKIIFLTKLHCSFIIAALLQSMIAIYPVDVPKANILSDYKNKGILK